MDFRCRAKRGHEPPFFGRFRVPFADFRGARRPDVRPGAEADDEGVRGASYRALRNQQFERAERRLKPHAGAVGFIEELLVGDDLRWVLAAFGPPENNRADRFGRSPAAWTRDARDRHGYVGFRRLEGATSHGPGGCDAHRAERFDNFRANVQVRDFSGIGIGYVACLENV